MDQLKTFMAGLKKHHFWVLMGLIVVFSVGIWFTSVRAMGKKYEERKSTLTDLRDTMQSLAADTMHPNEGTIESIDRKKDEMEEIVYKAWTGLEKDQKAKNQWPKQLPDAFLNFINDPNTPPDAPISRPLREFYWDFIKVHFDEMLEIIDARLPYRHLRDELGRLRYDSNEDPVLEPIDRIEMSEMGADRGTGSFSNMDDIVLVGKTVWTDPEIYGIVEGWEAAPTTAQLRYAQEDLWVYEAVLRAIRDTNQEATKFYNAPIKRIESIQVGQYASLAFLESEYRVFGSELVEEEEETYYEEEDYSEDEEYDEMDTGMAAQFGELDLAGLSKEEQIATALKHGRYVDENGTPLIASQEEPFAEFRMMPINMVLQMDQTKIPELLVNLANSTMPIDIVRVSLKPGQGEVVDTSMFDEAVTLSQEITGSGEGEDYDDESGDEEDSDEEEGEDFDIYSLKDDFFDPNDTVVQIQGIIHIFNRPERESVGTGAGAVDKEQFEESRDAAIKAALEERGITPGEEAAAEPTEEPTAEPPAEPSEEPAAEPAEEPAAEPTEEPTAEPADEPTEPAGGEPAAEPAATP